MKRVTGLALALLVAPVACAGYAYQPPPGPRPVPSSWQPARVLRARLARRSAGQVVLDGKDGMSPDEAAVLAVAHNPRLEALRAERGIARAELVQAGILPNPRLSASVDFPVAGGGQGLALGYGAGLTWNLTPLVSRGARRAAAKQNLVSVDLNVAWKEWQVAEAARLHAVRAIYLERRVRVARQREQTWRARLAALRTAQGAEAVTALQVTNADRSLSDAEVDRLELQRKLVNERILLDRALGVDPQKTIALDLGFQPVASLPNARELIRELPRRRLDLIALAHAQRSRDEALRAAALAEFPAIELGVRAQRDVERATSVGPTLSFEIPFFNRNQGAVARERAERRRVEAEYHARLFEARADVVRLAAEIAIVQKELVAAKRGAEAAGRLAAQAQRAATSGALNPLIAADILDRSYKSRLRALTVEQRLAELDVALAVASGEAVK